MAAHIDVTSTPAAAPEPELRTAAGLLARLGQGNITSSAYDTAQLARLRTPHPHRGLHFPETVDWLLAHQHPDGSWGGTIAIPHDRAVCTLAATVALAEADRDQLLAPGSGAVPVARGVAYLARHSAQLRGDPHETVAFEMIFPTLLDQAQSLRLALPYADYAWIHDLKQRKLALFPTGSRHLASTLAHSLESLDDRLSPEELTGLAGTSGSIGCSPSSTAYAHTVRPTRDGLRFLQRTLRETPDGGAPTISPYEVFDRIWVLDNLRRGGLPTAFLRPHIEPLRAIWRDDGIGMAADGIPTDCDDTAVAIKLLRSIGHSVPLEVLRPFESPRGYRTYHFERHPSVSANIHVLNVLTTAPDTHRRQITSILAYLADSRTDSAYWYDKWHASAYYASCRALEVLSEVAPELGRATLEWLLDTRHSDGGWSAFEPFGTCEETAYAVSALIAAAPRYQLSLTTEITQAIAFLRTHQDEPLPELWLGKALYTPQLVVRSAILAALTRHHTSLTTTKGPGA
ncbi:prenyltransferase/squalene oxidase repeat-containing protein [Streptomyces sp. NPDC019443]|uniref:prenyltransferase/squalene oxidase repeat-containing protein n=1 Tax=Streptomyces sp. NPDC019443 TaxID=3365061 RepID=UPI0037BB039F